jgi:hypothetical protein
VKYRNGDGDGGGGNSNSTDLMVTAVSKNDLFKPLFSYSVRNIKFTVTVSLLYDKIKYTHSNAWIFPKSFAINVDSLY